MNFKAFIAAAGIALGSLAIAAPASAVVIAPGSLSITFGTMFNNNDGTSGVDQGDSFTVNTVTGALGTGSLASGMVSDLSGDTFTIDMGVNGGNSFVYDGYTFNIQPSTGFGVFNLTPTVSSGSVGGGVVLITNPGGETVQNRASYVFTAETGGTGGGSLGITVSAIPVPAALPLLGTALAGIAFIGRRRRAA